jgi:hypothetical protein
MVYARKRQIDEFLRGGGIKQPEQCPQVKRPEEKTSEHMVIV